MTHGGKRLTLIIGTLVLLGTSAAGLTNEQKCHADKLKRTGKYAACRMKAEAKAVKTQGTPNYTRCDEKLVEKFGSDEAVYATECPTTGDVGQIQSQATADTDFLTLKLSGVRFVDNGDGTITDAQTALTWEKKDHLGGVNDVDSLYQWTAMAAGTQPDGTAFTTYLAALNHNTSSDGNGSGGCFANHCDWRLPTSAELRTILAPGGCGINPCIDPAFGPTAAQPYWSSTTHNTSADAAWVVSFDDGSLGAPGKVSPYYVRAVRGGL